MSEPAAGASPRPPPALSAGGCVALIAPASPYDPDEFARGRQRLAELGYRVRVTAAHRPPGALTAGTVARRLEELHTAFDDDRVDAVLAIRGGYGVMQLLAQIDWDLLRAHPKPLVGLSDLTPLLNAVADRAGMVTLHGPMAAGLGGRTDEPSVARLLAALTEPEPLPPMRCDGEIEEVCLSPGVARGPICGGNLTMIGATLGTPFELQTDDRLLLLEDVAEPPYRIDRALTQLRLAGKLDRVAGIGFGEMLGCDPPEGVGYDLRGVVRDALADLPVPVVWGLPFGHGSRNWTFPVGGPAELDAGAGRLRFLAPAVTARAPAAPPGERARR